MAIAAGDGQHQLATALPCGENKIIKLKLVATLEEIWDHIETKKDEMEIICQETRKLLKPLFSLQDYLITLAGPVDIPQPKRLHQQIKSKDQISLQEKQQVLECKTTQLETPENEIAELNLIDKALEKAQKAWKKHRPATKDGYSCEESAEELVKDQKFKAELGSDSKDLGTTKVVSDDTKIGVISEKELRKALSNVQISQMKATYKKAPYKTFDCEQKKISHSSSQTNKSLPKPSSTRHSTHSASRNSNHSKDGKSHSSVKSLQANPNVSKDGRTHSIVKSLEINKFSGSFQEKKQNHLKIAESEQNPKKMEFKLDAGTDENKNSDPLYVISPSIKELYQKNNSLRRKLIKMNEHPNKSADSFLHLWESKMKKTPNEEVKLLNQKYENLFILLQSLNLPCISDSSSPEEILEAKITMEYILTSMYDLNNQTETLLKKVKSKSTVTPQMEPVPQTVPKEIWLPPHLLNSRIYQRQKESSLRLHYSSFEELDEYWDRQHKLQESLLSQHLLKIVFECLLPLLKSQNIEQREKIFLYRILRGFLHHNGRHFPTLIES